MTLCTLIQLLHSWRIWSERKIIFTVRFGKDVSYNLDLKYILRVQVLEGMISRVMLLGNCELLGHSGGGP